MATESKKLPTIEGFTPGPWGIRAVTGRMCEIVQGTNGKGRYIAVCGDDSTEQVCNQHLIAAAPDLYRIAHEQREVIRRMAAALRVICDPLATYDLYGNSVFHGREALTAAAHLLED